jgi:hypothetical protein
MATAVVFGSSKEGELGADEGAVGIHAAPAETKEQQLA